jgi:hypothetical protein
MRYLQAMFSSVVLAALSLIATGCKEPPAAVAPPPPKVTVMNPEQRELSDHEEFNGWMAADKTVRDPIWQRLARRATL